MTKKPNKADATIRNVRASAKRDASLLLRVQRIELILQLMAPGIWRKAAKAKP